MALWRSAVVVMLLLAGCDDEGEATDPVQDEDTDLDADPCDSLTWETAGGPVLISWCAGCHGSGVTGAGRSGAPAGIDLDSYEAAVQWLDRIEARSLSEAPDMPPATVVPAADLDALERWIVCERG